MNVILTPLLQKFWLQPEPTQTKHTHTHGLQSEPDHQSVGNYKLQIKQLLLQAVIKPFS